MPRLRTTGRLLLLLALGTALVIAARAEARVQSSALPPSAPWSGPEGAWLWAEGEDFSPRGSGWAVLEDASAAISTRLRGPVIAGDAGLSGVGAGDGTAVLQATVPAAGAYKLHVRFTQWPGAASQSLRAPFKLTITQNQTPRLEQVFARDPVAVGPSGQGEIMVRWQTVEVALDAGPATLTLSKEGQAEVGRRSLRLVDALLLTQDADYEPDHRDFGPQIYMRATLHSATPDLVYLYCMANHLRGPNYYTNLSFTNKGFFIRPISPEEEFLSPGDTTPWMNITHAFDHDADTIMRFATMYAYQHRTTEASYTLEFASGPDASLVYSTIDREGPGSGIHVRVPWNPSPGNVPKADYAYAAERLASLEAMPAVGFGKRPVLFPLSTGLGQQKSMSARALSIEQQIAGWLGLNTQGGLIRDSDIEAGILYGGTGASIWHMGPAGFVDPDLATMESRVADSAAKLKKSGTHLDRLLQTSLMDEAAPPSIQSMMGHRENQLAFARWVEENNLPVSEDEVLALLDDSTPPVELTADGANKPRLYYYSQKFRAWTIVKFFKQATDIVHKYYPPNAGTTQNFSDGAVYGSSMYLQGNDYWLWFRNKALDVAHSEDWTNHGATPQLSGWNVSLLRSATKYHDQPIHMYVIASGRAPEVVKLKSYANIAQGAKWLSFYSYSPEYGWHETGWATRDAMYPAIAELTREIGAAEELIMPASPRQASTAMIYSIPYDIWSMAPGLEDNTHGAERMVTWLAMRHAQVHADVLSDQDVREGRLAPYKVAYLYGPQIERGLCEPLLAWVRSGGTLVLGPGAGSRDEYNAPIDLLDRGLGLKRQALHHPSRVKHATAYLPRLMSPLEQVELVDASGTVTATVDALMSTQRLDPAGAVRVMARFTDGKPAAVERKAGTGRVIEIGFLPALAYLRNAYEPYRAAREAHQESVVMDETAGDQAEDPGFVPTQWDAALRSFIVAPALAHGGPQAVDASAPLVEATLMESDAGMVVPLANWSGSPLEEITITIRPGRPLGVLHSSRLGVLDAAVDAAGTVTVTLPLELTDMIYATWEK